MILTSLGASVDTRGAWKKCVSPGNSALSVEEWRHLGSIGRDHYVRVVYRGYLFPFGHAASLIKVTERKFHSNKPGNPAYLRQRMYIVVRQPVREYTRTGVHTDGHLWEHQMPFRKVQLKTLVTPSLKDPAQCSYTSQQVSGLNNPQMLFWPTVGTSYFKFHLQTEGLDGRQLEFTAPLMFVGETYSRVPKGTDPEDSVLGIVAEKYNNHSDHEDRRKCSLGGQPVMFGESDAVADTTFEADYLRFRAEIPSAIAQSTFTLDDPHFYPGVTGGTVRVPAMQHLTGAGDGVEVDYYSEYLKRGFDQSKRGEVFLKVTSQTDLDFNSRGDRSGGLLKPNITLSGLSRSLGPVGGALNTIDSNSFAPPDFFSGIKASLFGVIDFKELLSSLNLADGDFKMEQIPQFVTESASIAKTLRRDLIRFQSLVLSELPAPQDQDVASAIGSVLSELNAIISDPLRDPTILKSRLATLGSNVTALKNALPNVPNLSQDVWRTVERTCANFAQDLANVEELARNLFLGDQLTVRLDWKPVLKKWPNEQKPIFKVNSGGGMHVFVEMRAKRNLSAPPAVDVTCKLNNFEVDLIATTTSFLVLKFKKLEFFATTARKAEVNVELDDLEFVGVFAFVEALRNLIPLDGFSDPPALDVTEKGIDATYALELPNIAIGVFSLQNLRLAAGFTIPFVNEPLSVRFNFCERQQPFLLTVSMFGGGGFFGLTLDPGGVQVLEAAFEFGASVSIDFGVASGGVHVMAGIYFRMEQNDAALTGYFRVGGEVDVLGIVSVSIELNLSLAYEFASGKCKGRATLIIEIEVAMFSDSVEITCQRKFAGSNGDPTFEQLMLPEPENNPVLFPWHDYCEAFVA